MPPTVLRILVVVTVAGMLAGCASSDESDGRQAQSTVSTTRTAPSSGPERSSEEDGSGGFFDALSAFLEDDTGTCADALDTDIGPARGSTLRSVVRDVERLRQLRFRMLPKPRYLTETQLARRLEAIVDKEYPAAAAEEEERLLIAIGALPDDADLKTLLSRSLAAEVAGFYDPRTGELVIAADSDPGLNAFERLILSHELEHALADQALRMPSYLRADHPPRGGEDRQSAGLSVVEGDATLTMEAYAVARLDFLDLLQMLGPALRSAGRAGDFPHHLEASSTFPYNAGESFVCELYKRGGWRAVDRAYVIPPTTSAQIMFPERYFARERAQDPRDPRSPGDGWRRLTPRAVGAADLMWLFEAPGDDTGAALSDPRERAAAWAGGEAHVWTRDRKTAVGIVLVERRGERDLCASMRAWLDALIDLRHRHGAVRCSGREVAVGIAPTTALARTIAARG